MQIATVVNSCKQLCTLDTVIIRVVTIYTYLATFQYDELPPPDGICNKATALSECLLNCLSQHVRRKCKCREMYMTGNEYTLRVLLIQTSIVYLQKIIMLTKHHN